MSAEEPLPPFKPDNRCPKCWHPELETQWHEELGRSQSSWFESNRLTEKEHIQRTCTRCTFRWAEMPMDKVAPLQQLGSVRDGEGS